MSSCALFQKSLAPKHNSVTDSLANVTNDQVYNAFQSWTAPVSYATAKPVYDAAEINIKMLISIDSSRKNGTQALSNAETWLNQLETVRNEHIQFGSFNKSQLQVNKDLLRQIGNIVYHTEHAYK